MLTAQPFGSADARVLIEDAVLSRLNRYAQHTAPAPEEGGVLMGLRRGEHIHVVDATTPSWMDRQSRFSFFRSRRPHESAVIKRWEQSGETMDYLGEWHTHPETCPTPSSIDLHQWTLITQEQPRPMLFLLVGTEGIWLGVGSGYQLHRLI